MAKTKDNTIELSKLKLDPQNPRHEEMASQQEIMEWMATGKGNIGAKVFELAKDICEYGVNDADRLIVVADTAEPGRYLTLEGNRRITALRFLHNPSSAPGNWPAKYSNLARSAKQPIPDSVKCVIHTDRDLAYHFVELKHLGQSAGAGTVDWGPLEKTRHQIRRTGKARYTRSLALLEHIKISSLYDDDVKEACDQIDVSTLDRIISDSEMRDFLGITDGEDGRLSYVIAPEESAKAISKMILEFGKKAKKVGDVINREKREEYRQGFSKKEKPDHSKRLKEPLDFGDESVISPEPKRKKPGKKTRRQYQNPRDRKYLPFSGEVLAIDPRRFARARYIFEELKSLQIDNAPGRSQSTFENAVSVLFRSFLEMSVTAYLERNKLTCKNPQGWRDVNLQEKIKTVSEELKKEGKLDKKQCGVINRQLGQMNGPAHPNQLNNWVHNYHEKVNVASLKDVWEVYSPFLHAVWESLHEKDE